MEILSEHCYIAIIFFPQIIAFDELKTDYKNPIDQCNTLNPVSDTTAPDAPSLPLTACRYALLKGFSFLLG